MAQRYTVVCPWCGAILERMRKVDRVQEKRPAGSRIEKNVARCPECRNILFVKAPAPPVSWRHAKLVGACALATALAAGIIAVLLRIV